jgi:hypothetical protein
MSGGILPRPSPGTGTGGGGRGPPGPPGPPGGIDDSVPYPGTPLTAYSSQKEFLTFPASAGLPSGQQLTGSNVPGVGYLDLWSDPGGSARVRLAGDGGITAFATGPSAWSFADNYTVDAGGAVTIDGHASAELASASGTAAVTAATTVAITAQAGAITADATALISTGPVIATATEGSQFVGTTQVDLLRPLSGSFVDLNGCLYFAATSPPINSGNLTTLFTYGIPNGSTYIDAEFVGSTPSGGDVYLYRALWLFQSQGGVITVAVGPTVLISTPNLAAGIAISGGNLLFQVNLSSGTGAIVKLRFRSEQVP